MGPKKSKAGQGARGQSASASAPQVDHAELKQAQNAYQQNSKKSGKKLISAIEDLRDKGTHMSRIVSLRLLLEKHEELKAFIDTEKVTKLDTFHQWLHSVLDGFKPEWERPLGDDRMSCTLVLALAACWRLHSTHCEVINEEDTTKVLSMCQRSFERGFSKQGWSKDWVDPRSEMVAAAEVTDAFVPECPTSAGMLGAQLLLLANAYARLLMPVMNSPWAAQFSPPRDILQTDWMKEAKVEVGCHHLTSTRKHSASAIRDACLACTGIESVLQCLWACSLYLIASAGVFLRLCVLQVTSDGFQRCKNATYKAGRAHAAATEFCRPVASAG